ncbi:MAG: amidohydrolase family protein [Candidatus Latescibacterota bacterium]
MMRSTESAGPPIIDVHLHAVWWEPGMVEPASGLRAPETSEGLRQATLAAMDRYGIVKGVVSGPLVHEYTAAAPDRIMAGCSLGAAFGLGHPSDIGPEPLRAHFAAGQYQVLAEVVVQYEGIAPGDSRMEPYLALAEELDAPVGIHIGLGPPGVANMGLPHYRMSHSNPLLLEDALVRHPGLRLWVCHAGWPMLDQTVGLLHCYPQIYVDISGIGWLLPAEEFHWYLRRLVQAGFGRRIMFGSDQMVWPDAIGRSVEAVETAGFLRAQQKRDIFYNNAARFLRMG